MKLIDCSTRNHPNTFAMVDDEDFDSLNQWKWGNRTKKRETSYAVRHVGHGKKQKTILMHRQLLNPEKNQLVDHIDRNGLNNQRSNIRVCSIQQNSYNIRPKRNGSSRYKGVYWSKVGKVWIAKIKANNKNIQLGRFNDEAEAAKVRDLASIKYHGDFAYLNFPSIALQRRERSGRG